MHQFVLCVVVAATPLVGFAAEDLPKSENPLPHSEVIEVTATRMEQPLLDTPVAVSVVDRQQLETTPANNYADLLRNVPGLNVAQTSASDYTIRTRGPTRTSESAQLVLVDGRSIYLEYYGYIIWGVVPVNFDEIEAVDVVRGPGSSVWGANALSGVINLRTRSPRDLQGGAVTASVGNRSSFGTSARWGGRAGPWSYKASAGYYRQDAWSRDDLLPDGSPFPPGYTYTNEGTRQRKFDVRADRELGPSSTLSLRGGHSGTQGMFHTPLGPSAVQPGNAFNHVDVDYTRGSFGARVYWNHVNGDAIFQFGGRRDSYENHTTVVEVGNRSLVFGKHMLVYGASARSNEFELSLAPDDNSRRDSGVYLEDIFEVNRSLEVNAGVRLDYFSTLGTVTSPRLSVIVKPAANHALRMAANRAYRAPTLLENYMRLPVPNAILLGDVPFFFITNTVGNENLREEYVDALEVGWSWQRGPLFIQTSLYRNVQHNITRFFPTAFYGPADPPPGWPGDPSTVPPFVLMKNLSFANVGTVRMQGVELSVDGRFRRGLGVRASYAYQFDPHATSHIPGFPLIMTRPPRHSASVSADKRTDRGFVAASVTYTDRAFWNEFFDSRFWAYTDAYTLVGASLGYSVTPKTQIVLSGTNLFDRAVKQHVFGDIIGRKTSIEVRQRF